MRPKPGDHGNTSVRAMERVGYKNRDRCGWISRPVPAVGDGSEKGKEMFLVIVENLPRNYRFCERHRESFPNILGHFALHNSNVEVIICSRHNEAMSIVVQWDRYCIWNAHRDRLHRLSVKSIALDRELSPED